MNVTQELTKKNLVQIDKFNPDFSELENLLNILNSDQHITIFVTYKQNIEDKLSSMGFIRIDLNQPFVKKYPHMVSSNKKGKLKKTYSKKEILNFVKKYL